MCASKTSGQLDARGTSKPKRCETLAWLLGQFEKGVETFDVSLEISSPFKSSKTSAPDPSKLSSSPRFLSI
jgi:hypothetical protein